MTVIGCHITTGSRNGYNGKLHRGVISFEHGALVAPEVDDDCFTVWRNIDQYGANNADIPPGFDQFTEEMARANARWWWSEGGIRAAWDSHPASAYKLTNEVGGSDEHMLRLLVAFEDEFMELNKAAGNPYTFLVASCAGDSPGWDTGMWQDILAPHIVKAWRYGHIYSRHAYTGVNPESPNKMIVGGVPADNNVDRPFIEIDWFLYTYGFCGPIIIGECGFVSYPGNAQFYVEQMTAYADYIHDNGYDQYIGFIASFTYGVGSWGGGGSANIQDASPVLNSYLAANPYTPWEPNFGGDMSLDERVAALESAVTDLLQRIAVLESYHAEEPPTEPPVDYYFNHGDLFVDLNYGRTAVNYQALVDNGVKGAIIRASSAKRYSSTDENGIDLQFWNHVIGCAAVGLPLGAYYFLDKNEPYSEQAQRFFNVLQQAYQQGYSFPLILAYDAEGDYSPQSSTELHEAAIAFMLESVNGQDVQANTRLFLDGVHIDNRLGIYTGSWWWNRIVNTATTWPMDLGLWCWAAWYVHAQGKPLEELPSPDRNFTVPNGWRREDVLYWQFASTGGKLVGQSRYELDLNYIIRRSETLPPPIAEKVDILPYIKGAHRVQFDKEYRLANGVTGTETVQLWHLSADDWLHIKGENGQYWHLGLRSYLGEDWIFMFEDTSESSERLFAHYIRNGGSLGAPWVPRYMEVGKWYKTPKFVQHYTKTGFNGWRWDGSCSPANSGDVFDNIRLTSRPYSKTYQSGQTLLVITLEWQGGEQYDFGGGNVAFRNNAGDDYWFMQYLHGRADKFDQIVKPQCINIGW